LEFETFGLLKLLPKQRSEGPALRKNTPSLPPAASFHFNNQQSTIINQQSSIINHQSSINSPSPNGV